MYDISHSKILYDPRPRAMEIKTEINKWDLIHLKSFCRAKETISKVKGQPSKWEKTIENETTDRHEFTKCISISHNSIPEKQIIQLKKKKSEPKI